jgi:PAS domain S-box-containing protein
MVMKPNDEQLNQRAQEGADLLTGIIRSAMDAIVVVDDDQRIVLFNAAAEKIFVCPANEAIGSSVDRFIPQRFRAGHSARVRRFAESGVTSRTLHGLSTLWGLRANGEEFPIEASISKVESRGKKFFTAVIRDITDRKVAEDRLREYEAAVEGAEDIIGVVDREYRLLLANCQYLKMRNMTREQVVGRLASEVLGKEVFETVIKPKLDECFQGKVVRYEMKFSYPTVGERDLLLSYFPIEAANGTIDRVACILHDITERKRAEEALLTTNRRLEAQSSLLHSREELLRVFVKNVPAAVAMLDRDMRYLQVSDRWCSDYLPGRAQILGRSHYEIFPDMPDRWKEVHRRALQGETLRADEDRWDGQDGPHWARWEVRPWKTPEGDVGGILIFAEDITHRKQMEEELSGMTRKLVEAQEQERTRIARELHDDITQRLAMLAIEIDHAPEYRPEMPAEVRDRAHELSRRAKEISSDVQSLSRQLHSSALEYLGLETGMKSWCKEFSERQKLQVVFRGHNVPEVPQEISLCLFRVLQEALQNAAKHSGAKRVEVQLAGNSGEIHLVVSDSGSGFDVNAPGRSRGLGLTSMQERVRLVGGTIAIESTPQAGTTILVSAPLGASDRSRT